MQKKKSTKKSGGKKKSTTGRKVKVTPKKEAKARSISIKEQTPVLAKLKEVLGNTAAKIKTLLPGDQKETKPQPFLRS
jgi:hypothetical protein